MQEGWRVTNSRTDETDRRLNTTVGLVVALGSFVLVFAIFVGFAADQFSRPPWLRLACVLAIVGLTNRSMLQVRIKASQHGMTMADAGVLIGLMLVPGSWLVVCTAIAVTASKITLRQAPNKVAFNAAKDTVVAGCAVGAAHLFGVDGPFIAT